MFCKYLYPWDIPARIRNSSKISFSLDFGITLRKVLHIHFFYLFFKSWFFLYASVEFQVESLKFNVFETFFDLCIWTKTFLEYLFQEDSLVKVKITLGMF